MGEKMTPDPYEELRRIAEYPDGLVTPFDWKAVVEKMQDIAARALGWRKGQPEVPDLRHKPRAAD